MNEIDPTTEFSRIIPNSVCDIAIKHLDHLQEQGVISPYAHRNIITLEDAEDHRVLVPLVRIHIAPARPIVTQLALSDFALNLQSEIAAQISMSKEAGEFKGKYIPERPEAHHYQIEGKLVYPYIRLWENIGHRTSQSRINYDVVYPSIEVPREHFKESREVLRMRSFIYIYPSDEITQLVLEINNLRNNGETLKFPQSLINEYYDYINGGLDNESGSNMLASEIRGSISARPYFRILRNALASGADIPEDEAKVIREQIDYLLARHQDLKNDRGGFLLAAANEDN